MKNQDLKSGDITPLTPFTRFCLSSLPPLTNFSDHIDEIKKNTEETKEPEINPCGCLRTKCLKLYCECFSNDRFCVNCNCKNCKNKPEFIELRDKAKSKAVERNPIAFSQNNSETYKACHCKRSACRKKYCECFEENRFCTASCRCEGCQNVQELNNKRKKL